MFKSSLSIGHIRGIRIQIHISWLIIFVLLSLAMIASLNQARPEWSQTAVVTTTLVSVLLFFASIVLHELGHSLVALSRGIPVPSITLFVFGGMSHMDRDAETARDEFWIAVVGPLISLLLGALFLLLGWLLPLNDPAQAVFNWVGLINLVVAIFNLIPGFPLDGGRVFRALVWGVTGDPAKAMRWAVMAGRFVAYALFALGIFVLLSEGLWSGLWIMAIAWFLLSAAAASGLDFSIRQVTRNVRARDLMESNPPRVLADTSIDEWINKHVLPAGHRASLVEHHNEAVGLITLSDANRTERERWADTPVDQVMTPKRDLYTVSSATSADEVLQLLNKHSLNQIPVKDADRLVGWINREHVLQNLQIRMELENGKRPPSGFMKGSRTSR